MLWCVNCCVVYDIVHDTDACDISVVYIECT